jgi:hypothetical protein
MNRTAVSILLGLASCHKHEDAKPEFQAVAVTDPTASVAAPPPSDPAPVASVVPSAELSAKGNMWGDVIGDALDAGGLGLTGLGTTGGRGEGIGLGNIGTIGHGAGTGTSGNFSRNRDTRSPHIRQGTTTVNGRLPPEVIQRIVRQNFGRFKLCYLEGLNRDPKLTGMVATKFVIDRAGAVSTAAREATTTMPDAAVVSCVVRGFSNLSFPQPEGGIVTVVYPVIFDPGD